MFLVAIIARQDNFTRTNASIAKAIANGNVKVLAITETHVIVSFEKDIVEVYHGCQDICLLLHGNILGNKGNFVNVGIRKGFAEDTTKRIGFDLGNGSKVAKGQLVQFLHRLSRTRNGNAKLGVATKFRTTSKKAGSSRGGEHFGVAGWIARILCVSCHR